MIISCQLSSQDLWATTLVRHHWRSYLFVSVAAILVHIAWLLRFGGSPSTDFEVVYGPAAEGVLSWLRGGEMPEGLLGAYRATRAGYIAFVAICFYLFGNSLEAVIYPQVALVWLVYPLIFHILLYVSRRHDLSIWAMVIWLTFYDGYQWHFWAVPDSIFRLIFLSGFFILLRLWHQRRDIDFIWTTLLFVMLGTIFRLETALYSLPALWHCSKIIYIRHRAICYALIAVLLSLAWMARGPIAEIWALFVHFQSAGIVLEGLGYHVPSFTIFGPPADNSFWAWLTHLANLLGYRLYYAITPFPVFWSHAHQTVYAIYVIPAYVLTMFGLIEAWRRGDRVVLLLGWVFAAGLMLRMLVHVDPPMRYGYTPQVFLFFCAVMGWSHVRKILASRRHTNIVT